MADHLSTALDWGWLEDPVRAELVAALQLGASASNAVLLSLARLACVATGAPCSQISIIGDEQAIPASCGFVADPSSRTPATDSLCAVTVASGHPFAVPDAHTHPWVRDLPPVTRGDVRSYLGAPVFAATGHAVGAVCVFGPAPRDWQEAEMETMVDLAEIVSRELELQASLARTREMVDRQAEEPCDVNVTATPDGWAVTAAIHGGLSKSDAIRRAGIELLRAAAAEDGQFAPEQWTDLGRPPLGSG